MKQNTLMQSSHGPYAVSTPVNWLRSLSMVRSKSWMVRPPLEGNQSVPFLNCNGVDRPDQTSNRRLAALVQTAPAEVSRESLVLSSHGAMISSGSNYLIQMFFRKCTLSPVREAIREPI
jgi:hypothetical protein